MLSDILMIIFGLYVMFSPFLMVYCIKFGARMAIKPEEEADEPTIDVKLPRRKAKLSPEDKANVSVLREIEKFDGLQGVKR